jgi:hypothetical protein
LTVTEIADDDDTMPTTMADDGNDSNPNETII